MAKRKLSKKYKSPVNIYGDAGWLEKSRTAFDNAFKNGNGISSISSMAGSLGTIVNAGLDNAKLADITNLENSIDDQRNYIVGAVDNNSLLNEWGNFSTMDNVTWKDIRGGSTRERVGNTLGATLSGATTGAQVGGPIGAVIGGVVGLGSGIAGWLTGNKKAKNKARQLNEDIEEANNRGLASLEAKAQAIDTQNDLIALANYAANGGMLNMFNTGGNLKHQHGGIFSNGIITVDNGGTHESNPYEGVQIGIDPQGIPNLVEEGEVIWGDYVFSNRLKPTQEFKDKYKVKGDTFADVAKNIQLESAERPNDPISKKGLEDTMIKLQMEQEIIRSNKRVRSTNKFYGGGKIADRILSDGTIVPMYDSVLPTSFRPTFSKSGLSLEPSSEIKRLSYNSNDTEEEGDTFKMSPLRYAPILGSALGTLDSIFNKPNYSGVEALTNAAKEVGKYTPVSYTPISNYLSYNPFDTNFYINKLDQQAGANRRAIINQSAGNRATAVAGLLASDFNTLGKYGDLARQAEEFNRTEKARVQEFNRGTNQTNAENAFRAAVTNAEADRIARNAKADLLTKAAMYKDSIDKNHAANISANLTNLFDNLGAVGKERTMIDMFNNNPSLMYEVLSGKYKGNTSACGGYLTTKKRRK